MSNPNPIEALIGILRSLMRASEQRSAEAAFEAQWRGRSGTGAVLSSIGAAGEVDVDVRHMALLLLKRVVADDWQTTMAEDEKRVVRATLCSVLSARASSPRRRRRRTDVIVTTSKQQQQRR